MLRKLGSSPLARGLRHKPPSVRHWGRIIPARAGFTPRDRREDMCFLGSSPLARGLLEHEISFTQLWRIIPARAGFTLGDRRDSNGGPPYQGAFAFTGDLGTARLSCGSVVAGQRSTTTPSPV